ncbi:exodeoxyribonuclease V subunit alpha [Photobacterium jeanii]|uniref:RecBCD enzyme subunit RecD n=1 Tax=Photobacterium jeanii TaxID=858640 RepID=A0A178KAF0_9GAMM|nr:exodeoxyribonuclease V subunit alpha [Photobacterium jeanii]OAN14036.1 exodeoxyribonuclease V subunit alpha [Photobacterium jeanii]PST86951.1 exodeoxyribonuclease V subunit alpha [Photobacterium jeanii]
MLKRLHELTKQGVLRPLDYQFAKFVAQHCQSSPQDTPTQAVATLAAAWASYELGKGNVCLVLNEKSAQRVMDLPPKYTAALLDGLPDITTWPQLLADLPVVSSGDLATPLVLTAPRLYLHRYWHYEQVVANKLTHAAQFHQPAPTMAKVLDDLFPRTYGYLFEALAKLKAEGNDNAEIRQDQVCDKLDIVNSAALDWAAVDAVLTQAEQIGDLAALDKLVPTSVCLNWQKVAAAMALTRQFAVISGGPGTGKTTTVAKLLAALVMEANLASDHEAPTIKLVAPTGKAAARLTESIGSAVKSLPVESDIKALIPTQSSTIHRLLGAIPNSVDFRHHRDNPLHLDVLVVDEASMIDLPMMARLLDALPPHAKLILLGDKDQLASVEAGAVLGDICDFIDQGYSSAQAQQLSMLTGYHLPAGAAATSVIADSLCMLRKSYRFHAKSGIGQLAKAINSGKSALVDKVWQQGFADIRQYPLSADNYQTMIKMTVNFYRDYLDLIEQQASPSEVLNAFAQVRLLCALREGDFGVTGLNQRIERGLERVGKISTSEDTWYLGRPVMITRNDHGLGLYNGDIGIAMYEPSEPGVKPRLRVYFEMPDGSIYGVLPSRLPEHDTAYAMTIHKSQGSEFADTLMVLPNEYSPILTRELVYTGVTRAKARLHFFAQPDVVSRAVRICTDRASGLAQLLG